MDGARVPIGYRSARAVLARALALAYDIDVVGWEQLPVGPVILAANHRSFMDSMFIAFVMEDRPVTFLAKAEYFERKRTAWFFRLTGQIPIHRGSPAGARRALEDAATVLRNGGTVGVYPEGTRSRDGQLHRGRLGPARLAFATGAPIVPVGLVGTEHVQPPDRRVPSVGKRVSVRFGPPLLPDLDRDPSGHDLRGLTERLMDEIATLCGQSYTHRASEVATGSPA